MARDLRMSVEGIRVEQQAWRCRWSACWSWSTSLSLPKVAILLERVLLWILMLCRAFRTLWLFLWLLLHFRLVIANYWMKKPRMANTCIKRLFHHNLSSLLHLQSLWARIRVSHTISLDSWSLLGSLEFFLSSLGSLLSESFLQNMLAALKLFWGWIYTIQSKKMRVF